MRGGCKGFAPPLCWQGSLLVCLWIIWFCWLLRITSHGFYEPLLMSCSSCWESLQILADRSGSFSICFSESLQIHADLCRSICKGAAIWVPTLPSSSDVSNLFGKYGGSGEYFSTDLVQCDSASWQLLAGVIPAHGVAMDTFLHWSEVLRPPANIQGSSSLAHLLAMSLTILLLIIYK